MATMYEVTVMRGVCGADGRARSPRARAVLECGHGGEDTTLQQLLKSVFFAWLQKSASCVEGQPAATSSQVG